MIVASSTLLLTALSVSCVRQETTRPDAIVISVRSNVGPLDPAVSPDTEQLQIIFPAYDNLVSITSNPETGEDVFHPEIASSWTVSPDRLVWTFALSDRYVFDSGRRVDAEAVKFTFDRLMAISRGPSSSLKEAVGTVEVLSPQTVRFTLKRPLPSFLPLIADRAMFIIDPGVMAHEIDGDHASQWLSTHSAGSGPYRLVKHSPRDVYILEPNPFRTDPPRQIQKIIYKVANDPSVRALQLAKGDIDLAYFLPAELIGPFREDPRYRVDVISSPAMNFLAFNMERPALADRRLREAVAHAIDYEAIVRDIKYGLAEEFRGPLLPGMIGYRPDEYPYAYDPEKARELIASLRRDGPLSEMTLIYPGVSAASDTMAIFIQSSLAASGIDLKLQRLTVPAIIDRIQRGNYDLLFMGWVSAYGDPSNIMNVWFDPKYKGGSGNYARYENPEVTELLAKSLSEGNPQIRASLLQQSVDQVNRDLPYVYLVKNAVWTVASSRLQGLSFDQYNLFDQDFHLMTLTEDETP